MSNLFNWTIKFNNLFKLKRLNILNDILKLNKKSEAQ